MNEEELKRYKEQIERLKREFHKDSPQNIENPSEFIPKKAVVSVSEKTASNPLLTELKNIGNVSKDENIPVKAVEPATENLIKKETSEPIETPLEPEKIPEIVVEQAKIPEVNVAPIETPIIKPAETWSKSFEDSNKDLVKEPVIVEEINQNIPPIIPPITASELAADEEHKKSSILKYISLIVGILVLGVVAFYFYNKNVTNDLKHANQVKVEKAFADSVLAYEENLKIEQEIEEKYAAEQAELERLEQERIVFISDTIFNLSELEVATGYYAIIGSFSDMNIAKKFKNKTKYPEVIFSQDKIRKGLKLSDDDVVIFEELEKVRKSYPEAWLLYNRH